MGERVLCGEEKSIMAGATAGFQEGNSFLDAKVAIEELIVKEHMYDVCVLLLVQSLECL